MNESVVSADRYREDKTIAANYEMVNRGAVLDQMTQNKKNVVNITSSNDQGLFTTSTIVHRNDHIHKNVESGVTSSKVDDEVNREVVVTVKRELGESIGTYGGNRRSNRSNNDHETTRDIEEQLKSLKDKFAELCHDK